MTKKLINKHFLINALNDEDQRLAEYAPKVNYRVVDTLDLSLDYYSQCKVNGIVVSPLLMPDGAKTKIPLTLFSLTDSFGLFYTSLKYIAPATPPYQLLANGINGFGGAMITFLNADIGDYYRQINGFVDITAVEIDSILTTTNQISYGTILNSLSDNVYLIDSLRIQVPTANINQFDNPLLISRLKINGKITVDTINIRTYVTPQDFNTSIAVIPLNIILDKNLMINQYINYDCQNVQYQFKLKKIK